MPDVGGARMLGRDILDQCSPKRNVHDLDSAADAEGWDTMFQSRVEEIDFELIAIRINAVRGRVDVAIAVAHGINVWPAAQEKTVNNRHEFVDRIVLWRQDDGNATRGLHCPHIWRAHAIPQKRAMGEGVQLCRRGYADDRLH